MERVVLAIFIGIGLVLLLSSCAETQAFVTGKVAFTFDLSEAKAAGYNITRVHVTLTHESGLVKETDLTVDSENNRAYGTVSGLRVGTWSVLAELYENETEVGSGTANVVIEAGKTTDVTIRINLETGSANINVVWGSSSEIIKLRFPYTVTALDVFDWNGDGVDEMIVGNDRKELFIAEYTDGTLTSLASTTFDEIPRSITHADIDNDGRIEIIVGTGNGDDGGYVYVGEFDASGWHQEWESPRLYSLRSMHELSVGDEDGNGMKEIAVGVHYYGRYLVVYEYNGSSFVEKWRDNIGSDVESVFYMDFDGDGKDELAVGTSHWSDWAFRVYDNGILVKRVGGDMSKNYVYGARIGGKSVVVRGKGKHTYGSGNIGIELYEYQDGEYIKTSEYEYPSPDSQSNVYIVPAACDIDHDGDDEVVFIDSYGTESPHPENSNLSILKYDGDFFHKLREYEIPLLSERFAPYCGDIDGDEKIEIMISINSSSPTLYVIKP